MLEFSICQPTASFTYMNQGQIVKYKGEKVIYKITWLVRFLLFVSDFYLVFVCVFQKLLFVPSVRWQGPCCVWASSSRANTSGSCLGLSVIPAPPALALPFNHVNEGAQKGLGQHGKSRAWKSGSTGLWQSILSSAQHKERVERNTVVCPSLLWICTLKCFLALPLPVALPRGGLIHGFK